MQYYYNILNQPNLRGVADTFKEQVAEALGNPDDIKMYQRCDYDACCEYEDDEDSEDIKMLSGKCSCPWKKHEMCGEGGEEREGGEGEGCAHCQACCSYEESDSFLTYCRGEGKRERCMENGCCDGGDEEEDDEGEEEDWDGDEGEGGHGGEGGQCPDCGTTNLCCY